MIKIKKSTKGAKKCSRSNNILELKEKDLCKAFYHKVLTLQVHCYFPTDFFLYHIANQQNNSMAYTMELKRMGLQAGVSDYGILFPGAHIAFIEFKRNAKSKLSLKQQSFAEQCAKLDIPFFITHDIEKAIEWIRMLCLYFKDKASFDNHSFNRRRNPPDDIQ